MTLSVRIRAPLPGAPAARKGWRVPRRGASNRAVKPITSLLPVALLASAALAACASAPKPEAETARTKTTSAAITASGDEPAASEKTAAERWAESKSAKDDTKVARPAGEGFDPLSEGAALEAANIPKIERTDKKLVRGKSRGELGAALDVVKTAATVEEAVTKLTSRLGKVSWTENGSKHIWIANDASTCHRLILEADGSVHVETVAKKDMIRLTTTVRQNPCTGEIERGGTN